jgi:MSHA biogenesis protein MshJ
MHWKEWAARLDELSLRERGLMFAAVVACLILLVYGTALQPLLRVQRGYLERLKQNESQTKAVNEVLVKSAREANADPHASKRARVRALELRLDQAERMLSAKRNSQVTPEQLASLLQEVLAGNRELKVLALRVLPASVLSAEPARGADAAKTGKARGKAPSRLTGAALYRHGVEIELVGSYLDIVKYLGDVEKLRWKLNWSSIELETLVYPEIKVRATLSTVSTSPSLLEL